MPANDLSIYELDMQTWWDDRRGPMAPLHWLTPSRFDYFKQAVAALDNKQVLDIGCGGGLLAERFADAGAHVVGADLLWPCVQAAQAHGRANDARVTYVQMRAERLAAIDRSFDIVVAADVLEHVTDLGRTIGEIGRVLRAGGVFLFDTINRTRLARWFLIGLGENLLHVVPHGTHDWNKFIRPRELSSHLDSAGMKLEHVTGLGPVAYWKGRVRFGRLPFTWLSYMGWARKLS
jgi:2-polyprenyl-6-hydroxyphenyl methylase/3-demethylubiquinone-9 3-methyltransferase